MSNIKSPLSQSPRRQAVAVTGAAGYIASSLILKLLEKGYTVHGTVRSLQSKEKISHLLSFPDFPSGGKLILFEADLLDEGSFNKAFQGVDVVFHVASPFQLQYNDGKKELVEPAVHGTENVVKEALKSKTVKRIIVTSSMAAVKGDRPSGHVYTEKDFNDTVTEKDPYMYSKVLAEKKAWELINQFRKTSQHVDLVTICPGFVFGPVISSRKDCTSANFITSLVDGSVKEIQANRQFTVVDIRDVVDAHIRVMEDPFASGRYFCCHEKSIPVSQLAKILAKAFPKYPVPTKVVGTPVAESQFDNSKLKKLLGRDLIPIEKSLKDMVHSLISHGLLKN